MHKYLIIIVLIFNTQLTIGQMNNLYHLKHYYNPTLYASKKIKTCKIYEEELTDSMPQKILKGEERYDMDGKLYYDRVFYTADTLEGILRTYQYDSLGRVTRTYWTWIEHKETDRWIYVYNSSGFLTKNVRHKKIEPNTEYKRVETKKLYYNKQGKLLHINARPRITNTVWYKNKTYYEHRNDTTFELNNKSDDYHAYVNGQLVEYTFGGNIYAYEYDSMQHRIKLTVNGPWKVIQTEEYTYENGLIKSSYEVIHRLDGTVKRSRTFEYELY